MSHNSQVKDSDLAKSLACKHETSEDKIKVLEWSSSSGSAAEDNFTCDMIAVKGSAQVGDEKVDFSFMVKSAPINALRAGMVEKMGLFERESLLYEALLPQMKKLRAEKGLAELATPDCLFCQQEPGILVMNNLKDEGMDLLKNQPGGVERGLQGSELNLFLRALGSFHATTYQIMMTCGGREATLEKYPALKQLNDPNAEMTAELERHHASVADNVALIARDFIGEEAHQKMIDFKPKVTDTFNRGFYKPCGDFRLIIHGDAWQNNAMFKYNEGQAESIKMVDFQCIRMSNPAIDLVYCLVTGTKPCLRGQHLDEWLQIYHDQFTDDMQAFGFDAQRVYPLEQLKKDYNEFYSYGFIWGLQHGLFLLKQDDEFDLAKFKAMDDPKEIEEATKKIYFFAHKQSQTNLVYRERIVGLVNEAIKYGAI